MAGAHINFLNYLFIFFADRACYVIQVTSIPSSKIISKKSGGIIVKLHYAETYIEGIKVIWSLWNICALTISTEHFQFLPISACGNPGLEVRKFSAVGIFAFANRNLSFQ